MQFSQSFLHGIIKFLCSIVYRKHEDFENGLTCPNSCIQIEVMPILQSETKWAQFCGTPCILDITENTQGFVFWLFRCDSNCRIAHVSDGWIK